MDILIYVKGEKRLYSQRELLTMDGAQLFSVMLRELNRIAGVERARRRRADRDKRRLERELARIFDREHGDYPTTLQKAQKRRS